MKPLAPGQPPRTRFLVKELKYVPRTIYRILAYSSAHIKGHDNEEDVLVIMKNILLNVIHGIKMNLHDIFLRTLANNALSPSELKIYAPWIMRFIRTRSAINYQADYQNHFGYLLPLKVIKKSFEPVDCKVKLVIDEGNRPLDGQFCKAASYSSYDDTATQESDGRAKPRNPTAPRVMTSRELVLSLHQKVDKNYKWVKHQFGSIVKKPQ